MCFVDLPRSEVRCCATMGELSDYMAESRSRPRRVIVRDNRDDERRQWDPRFIRTKIPNKQDGKCGKLWRMSVLELYSRVYCERGTMENSIRNSKRKLWFARELYSLCDEFLPNAFVGHLSTFFRFLCSCFYPKSFSWGSASLNYLRNAFICVPALLIELKIHANFGNLDKADFCRF